jgi:hypothetical protein
VNHSYSRGGNLSVLLSLAAALVVFSLYTGIFAYGQQSDSLGNLISQVNNNTNQLQHSDGKQELVIIPSLSSNELSTVVDEPEPNEEIRKLEQGLASQRSGIDFIEENREKAEDALDSISATESEEDENQMDEIQKQQEDTQEKLVDKLDAAESKTSETVEEKIRQSENIQNEQNDDTNGKEDKETDKDSGVPIELPFP